MQPNRTETRWFFMTIIFLIVYSVFLLVFRRMLLGVENQYQVSIYKPESVQVSVMGLLIILYHFGFSGLYYFSRGRQWQKFVAALVCLLITGSLIYGFNEWYKMTSNPFLQYFGTRDLPWYAVEKTKFLLVNAPVVLYFLIVFIVRVLMVFNDGKSSAY